ncbi:MAG: class I SAM-dependent methyltransferase [Actinomycetota bacterium]
MNESALSAERSCRERHPSRVHEAHQRHQAREGRSSRARHEGPAATRWQQVVRVVRAGRVSSFPLLFSDQARSILARGYDAFTTDRAYQLSPNGWAGPIGRAADRRVLALPVHVALRERLVIVADALERAVRAAACDPVGVLSAPCGLIRDLTEAAERLSDVRVTWTAADLDDRGDVLPEAIRRSRTAGLNVAFVRGDLFDPATWNRLASRSPFHVASCIGLTAWVGLDEVGRLAERFHDFLGPGGTLLMDNWREDTDAALARALDLPAHYHDSLAFRRTLEREGFVVERRRSTSRGVNTLWVLHRR